MAPKEVISDQCSVISPTVVAWSPDRVVAWSPDHATRSTEGLRAPADTGDLPSDDVRGRETRARHWGQETRAQRRVFRRAPARDRRGVLILVVLSLLILFVVIAVMFVVVASRARAVARVYSDVGRTGDTPEEIVYGVALDLVRGSLNPHSPFRTTSLLEDMYGHHSVRGKVSAAAASVANPSGAGGLIDILAVQPADTLTPRSPGVFSNVKDAYSGCVLTFITGPAKGTSARILEYWPAGALAAMNVTDAKFRLSLIRNEYNYDQPAAVQAGSQFVINGRAFSGTGIGYNPAPPGPNNPTTAQNAFRVNAVDANSRPYALMPNPAFFIPSNTVYGVDPAGFGGAHEGYDAPDFQNPFLAFYAMPNINPTIPNAARQIKPSFHDPALLGFWARQPGGLTDLNLVRQIFFRPNPIDHPVFHASVNPALHARIASQNPNFELGPWDIDNDGDGVPDSVWIDPGYPVQMTAQGRLYKTLTAVLVLDLDGRLNVNAHGSLEQLAPTATQMPSPQTTTPSPLLAGGATFANPPRGSGYGPAEIRIDRVLPGTAAGVLQTRYGQLNMPGQPNVNDPFSAVKLFAVSDAATDLWPGKPGGPGGISLFGAPPDVKGMLAVALDPMGQPTWDKPNWTKERADNPYEIDLSRYSARALSPLAAGGAPYDSPFAVGELELVLRPNDIDSGTLPMRLGQVLTQDLAAVAYRRNEITTDSWDPPVPSIQLPVNARRSLTAAINQGGFPARITSMPEMLYTRLLQGGVTQPDVITRHIDGLLSHDVRRGLRMDINRPFGNGVDGDPTNPATQNGIVDDASEGIDTLNYQPLTGQNQRIPLDTVNSDLNGDGQHATSDRYLYDSRQLLARHLYVLMMLFTDDNFAFPVSVIPGAPATPTQAPAWGGPAENLQAPQLRELKAMRLAQWAINVVDFRDADNIMTPFPFDMNPFNGWDPSGPERGFVWGCETPVAMLTETLAFHDRRVKDHDHDDGQGTKRDNATNPDPTLDQPKIPRGSAFVEILAIFSANAGVMSRDLFEFDTAKNEWVLDLGKVAPGGKPVWRLAVTEFHSDHNSDSAREKVSDLVGEHPDTVSLQPMVENETPPRTPWNFSLLNQPLDTHEVKIERVVWFANTAPTTDEDAKRTFYPSTAVNARLQGFQYAVVGPGGLGAGDRTRGTLDGIPVGGSDDDQTAGLQLIRLGTAMNPSVSFRGTETDSQANIKPSIGIGVASPAGRIQSSDPNSPWGQGDRVGFSISEPLFSTPQYYPKPDVTDPNTTLEEAYGAEGDNAQKFRDQPLDGEPGMPLRDRDMTKTGTYANVRTVFLQRLADPTQQHHPQMNPYITVDWMPIDLTVFNGEDRYPDGSMVPEDAWDPDDVSPNSDTNPNIKFSTRERGIRSTGTAGGTNTDFNIWAPVSEEPIKGNGEPSGPATNYFRHKLVHTLGHLNSSYGPPQTSPSPYHVGRPAKPFPWIRWANRPFANALELMEVPASTPARLGLEFTYVQNGTTSPYDTSVDPSPYKRQFNHLLNFFRSTDVTGNAQPGGDFYRIFDLVHVPSPFVGTETMLDPAVFHTPDPNNPGPGGAGGAGTEGFRAPFNWVSNYRDPGKINLNTINSPNVWNALTSVLPGPSRIPFGEFWATRRGGTPLSAGQISATPVPGVPTIMPNPYRSGGGGDMVPDLPGASPAQRDVLKRRGVSLTLLRETPGNNATGIPHLANPSRDPNANSDFANPHRNATFRYQQLQRLANLTTTRSNVYAIWITVGHFEVFPNPGGVDAGHPDGYQLGVELGSDTGQIERHRGFYIFDRSIPVGFERGFNHNVERALVLKRFIE